MRLPVYLNARRKFVFRRHKNDHQLRSIPRPQLPHPRCGVLHGKIYIMPRLREQDKNAGAGEHGAEKLSAVLPEMPQRDRD